MKIINFSALIEKNQLRAAFWRKYTCYKLDFIYAFVLFEFVGIEEHTFTITIKLILCSMLKFKAISKNTKGVDSTCKNYLAFQKFALRIGFTFFWYKSRWYRLIFCFFLILLTRKGHYWVKTKNITVFGTERINLLQNSFSIFRISCPSNLWNLKDALTTCF